MFKEKEFSALTVLTLNTHSWLEPEPLTKLKEISEVIRNRDLDVIALQEVNQLIVAETVDLNNFYQKVNAETVVIREDNFAYLLQKELAELGADYYWSWIPVHIGYDRYEEGVALLSKQPFEAEAFLVSESQDFANYRTRRVLKGVLKHQGQSLAVYSCHYSWWDTSSKGFAFEWQRTLKQAFVNEKLHIFLGDFNIPADKKGEGYDYLLQTAPQLRDAYQLAENRNGEHTVNQAIDGWKANQRKLRIDYGFVSAGTRVSYYEVIFDGRKTPIVSDHYGLALQIRI